MKGRALAANQLDTIESDFGRVVEAIDDDNVIASFEKGQRCERADVAGATIPITMLADPLDESYKTDIAALAQTTDSAVAPM